jgi:hypothetical protein
MATREEKETLRLLKKEIAKKVTFQNYQQMVQEHPAHLMTILDSLVIQSEETEVDNRKKEEVMRYLFTHKLDFTVPHSFKGCETVHQYLSTNLAWLRAGFQAGLNPNTIIDENPVLYGILQNLDEDLVNQAKIVRMFLEFGFVKKPGTEEVVDDLQEQWVNPEVNEARVFLQHFVETIPRE